MSDAMVRTESALRPGPSAQFPATSAPRPANTELARRTRAFARTRALAGLTPHGSTLNALTVTTTVTLS
jgi:hypothetical protein